MFWIGIVVVAVFVLIALVAAVLSFSYHRATRSWPHPLFRQPSDIPQPHEWEKRGLHITWIGHSTLLIQMNGLNILTDPVFGHRVGVHLPFFTIGAKRHVAPALSVSDLPPIDLLLLSHGHMDHFDPPSLRQIISPQTEVVTAAGTSGLLRRFHPYRIHELTPGQSLQLASGVKIVGQKVRHWGNRYPWNGKMGYLGYIVMRDEWRVFFAGDTAITDVITDVAAYRPQVTCMPIGAYAPETFQGAHCTPEQAWEMFRMSGAEFIVPMHHDTFVLSSEPLTEPLERLQRVAGDAKDAIVIHRQGQTFHLTAPDDGIED